MVATDGNSVGYHIIKDEKARVVDPSMDIALYELLHEAPRL